MELRSALRLVEHLLTRIVSGLPSRREIRTGSDPSLLERPLPCNIPSTVLVETHSFFEPGIEILLVRSASDVIRALRDVSDSDRLTMGRRAQRRVLDQHTSTHRAVELRDHILDAAMCRDRATSRSSQGAETSAPCQPVRTSLAKRIQALGPWFHNLELDGIQTAPDHFLGDYPRSKWQHFAHGVPADLGGRSVLDLGCNAGFYSFEMKRRGAGRVVAADCDERYLAQGRLAAEVLGVADVECRALSVYDVADLGERFDLVLFMGVLYHLRHPLLALDLLREHVVGDMLLFQSLQRGSSEVKSIATDYPFQETRVFEQPGYPHLSFVEHSYAGDPSNWWIPNRACAEATLRSAGFSVEQQLAGDTYLCRAGALGPLQEMRIRDGLGKRGLHELGASRDGGVA